MAENLSSSMPYFNSSEGAPSHELTYLSHGERAVLTAVFSLLSIFGLFGNGIVVYIVISFANYVDVPVNIFILSQAFADLGTVLAMPIYIVHMYSWNWELFYIYTTFVWLASLGSLFLLTFNRLISVVYSLSYARRMTPCRAKCLVVTIWLAAGSISMWHLYCDMASVHFFDMGRHYIVVIVMSVLLANAYMFRESRKQARKINRQSAIVTGLQKNLREDFKSVKTLGLVGGTFLLSCLPFTLVVFAYGDDKESVRFQRNAALWGPLMAGNAILDPLIYYFRSPEFRASYARLRRLYVPRRNIHPKRRPFAIFNVKKGKVDFCG